MAYPIYNPMGAFSQGFNTMGGFIDQRRRTDMVEEEFALRKEDRLRQLEEDEIRKGIQFAQAGWLDENGDYDITKMNESFNNPLFRPALNKLMADGFGIDGEIDGLAPDPTDREGKRMVINVRQKDGTVGPLIQFADDDNPDNDQVFTVDKSNVATYALGAMAHYAPEAFQAVREAMKEGSTLKHLEGFLADSIRARDPGAAPTAMGGQGMGAAGLGAAAPQPQTYSDQPEPQPDAEPAPPQSPQNRGATGTWDAPAPQAQAARPVDPQTTAYHRELDKGMGEIFGGAGKVLGREAARLNDFARLPATALGSLAWERDPATGKLIRGYESPNFSWTPTMDAMARPDAPAAPPAPSLRDAAPAPTQPEARSSENRGASGTWGEPASASPAQPTAAAAPTQPTTARQPQGRVVVPATEPAAGRAAAPPVRKVAAEMRSRIEVPVADDGRKPMSEEKINALAHRLALLQRRGAITAEQVEQEIDRQLGIRKPTNYVNAGDRVIGVDENGKPVVTFATGMTQYQRESLGIARENARATRLAALATQRGANAKEARATAKFQMEMIEKLAGAQFDKDEQKPQYAWMQQAIGIAVDDGLINLQDPPKAAAAVNIARQQIEADRDGFLWFEKNYGEYPSLSPAILAAGLTKSGNGIRGVMEDLTPRQEVLDLAGQMGVPSAELVSAMASTAQHLAAARGIAPEDAIAAVRQQVETDPEGFVNAYRAAQ
jgi:hypothetical protein